MFEYREMQCPVCGGEPHGDSPRCEICGFPFAFVRNFSGEKSLNAWQEKVSLSKNEMMQNMRRQFAQKKNFVLYEAGVSYISSVNGHHYAVTARGVSQSARAVMEFSASGHHEVMLYDDGTLTATGENAYGQCDVEDMRDIVSVTAAPNATYAIDKQGNVFACGLLVEPEIKTWTSMQTIVAGAYHVAGLREDGRVLVVGDHLDDTVIKTIESWKDVIAVAAAMDCTICLHKNGRVSFAGRATDLRREVEAWRDVVAIATDSVYAFGLDKKGNILMAGRCKNELLDMGRRNAATWKDVVAIACSRSGIGALLCDGTIRLAGNVRFLDVLQKEWKEIASTVALEMRKI